MGQNPGKQWLIAMSKKELRRLLGTPILSISPGQTLMVGENTYVYDPKEDEEGGRPRDESRGVLERSEAIKIWNELLQAMGNTGDILWRI